MPNTIANYLFNNKEENMTQIIKSIHEHDKEIRNSLLNNNDNKDNNKEDNTKDKEQIFLFFNILYRKNV